MKLTPEHMRDWERKLTPEQKSYAFELVKSWGWRRHETPPMYIWAEAYRKAEMHIPVQRERGDTHP